MRSLFARILLWFLATTTLTVVGLIVTRWLSIDSGQVQQSPFTRTAPFLLAEARHAYETGGTEALGRWMARMRSSMETSSSWARMTNRP